MNDREFIAVFHYDNGGTNRCGAEPYRYAEEIVRCKECKHWDRAIDENGIERFNFSKCVKGHYGNGFDFYCADGERREP